MYTRWNDELYHYGVLGMRWGHRKQEPRTGGTRKKTYSVKTKDKKKPLTAKEREIRKAKIKKAIAISGAAAVGAALTVYCVKRYAYKNLNTVLKSGTDFQRMSDSDKMNFATRDKIYAVFDKRDKQEYGDGKFLNKDWHFRKNFHNEHDINLAGTPAAEKIFNKYKETLVRKISKGQLKESDTVIPAGMFGLIDKPATKVNYKEFNVAAVYAGKGNKNIDALYEGFWKRMKHHNFDAVRDLNDQKNNLQVNPVIIFNKLKNFKLDKLTDVKAIRDAKERSRVNAMFGLEGLHGADLARRLDELGFIFNGIEVK